MKRNIFDDVSDLLNWGIEYSKGKTPENDMSRYYKSKTFPVTIDHFSESGFRLSDNDRRGLEFENIIPSQVQDALDTVLDGLNNSTKNRDFVKIYYSTLLMDKQFLQFERAIMDAFTGFILGLSIRRELGQTVFYFNCMWGFV